MIRVKKILIPIMVISPVFCFSQQQDTTTVSVKRFKFSQGGDVRFQFFHFDHQNWIPKNDMDYLLSRFLWNFSLRYGKSHELKIEFQSGLESGLKQPISPVDKNVLDLHQAYYKYHIQISGKSYLSATIGRQELKYGSQRIISVREGPNNRQSFDAIKLKFQKTSFTIDAFLSTYVQAKTGLFNDDFLNKNNILWGLYAVKNDVPILQNLDVYYLGIKRKEEIFNAHNYVTKKHSIGSRIWNDENKFNYDLEALAQWGKASTGETIIASTASAHISYGFLNLKWLPVVGMKIQYISGDSDSTDRKLNTFDPIYPKGAYFGLSPIIGPKNLTNIHFYGKLNPTEHLNISLEYIHFWRHSREDAVYDVAGFPLITSTTQQAKDIGSQYQLSPQYEIKEGLAVSCDLAYFRAGDFLKQSKAVDLFSAALGIQYSF